MSGDEDKKLGLKPRRAVRPNEERDVTEALRFAREKGMGKMDGADLRRWKADHATEVSVTALMFALQGGLPRLGRRL